jgi:hypothetical protein
VALGLSSLALIGTGLNLYQLSALRQELVTVRSSRRTLEAALSQRKTAPTPASESIQAIESAAVPAAAIEPSAQAVVASPPPASAIRPGQFVQPAFRDKGQVELLSVNRVTGERDVVNVQLRVHLFEPEATIGTDSIDMGSITAHNPNTSEIYEAVLGKSSPAVSLFSMRLNNQSAIDGYVWLRVPEGTKKVNLSIPNTQEFLNVPIPD